MLPDLSALTLRPWPIGAGEEGEEGMGDEPMDLVAEVEVVDDCPEHEGPVRGDGTDPYKVTINQRYAKELWERGEPLNKVNESTYAVAHLARGVVVNGFETNVVVKRWYSHLEHEAAKERIELDALTKELAAATDEAQITKLTAQVEEMREQLSDTMIFVRKKIGTKRARKDAILEVELHRKAWRRLSTECRRYLTVPACMSFDDMPAEEGTYTVQSYAEAPDPALGTITQTARSLGESEVRDGRLRNALSAAKRFDLVQRYAGMLACVHSAGIFHNDVHGSNVLVVHNLDQVIKLVEEVVEGRRAEFKYTVDFERLYFEWKLIDWGVSKDMAEDMGLAPTPAPYVCTGPPTEKTTKKIFPDELVWMWQPGLAALDAQLLLAGAEELKCIVERQEMIKYLLLLFVDWEQHYLDLNNEHGETTALLATLVSGSPQWVKEQRVLASVQAELDLGYMYDGEVTEGVVLYWLSLAYAAHLKVPLHPQVHEIMQARLAMERRYGGTGRMPDVSES